MIKVAINGFGRIGRTLTRLLLDQQEIELVAINDLAPINQMTHLLKYDSIHGGLNKAISHSETEIIVDAKPIKYFQEKSPENLPWEQLGIDIVIESTGLFRTREKAALHLKAGAKKIILSAPAASDDISTYVIGINEGSLTNSDTIISNASCTTNSAAPLIAVVNELCSIQSGYITTVHSYTGDQRLHDAPHNDLRRARAAAQSIVPTTTGAAKAITKIFPDLDGKLGGCGIRVPVPDGSLTDITCMVKNPKTVEEINAAFKTASENKFKGILEYQEDPIVSIDIISNPHSCIFDSLLTSVIGNMVKVVGWYDNESGYSNRLVDLIHLAGKTL